MSSASLLVEGLTRDDSAAGLALSSEAGWNQTAADWSYMLANGQGFGVRSEGQLVATSLALPYPPDFGWISMVLVSKKYRRRGLATLLLQAAVDILLARHLVPMLDATPEGREVYARLGFHQTEQVDRWARGRMGMQTAGAVAPAAPLALDLAAFGADRTRLLTEFSSRRGSLLLGTDTAYAIRRDGRHFSQVGPVVAATGKEGRDLVRTMLNQDGEPLVVDVPSRHARIGDELLTSGFSVQRQLFRMAWNRTHGYGDPSLVFAIAGPEFG